MCGREIQVRRKCNYSTAWFIYRAIISWRRGQEYVLQISFDNKKVYIIPAFFEDEEKVYEVLDSCCKFGGKAALGIKAISLS